MAEIYHIIAEAEWTAAQQRGHITADSLATDGFIHCSYREQVQPTLDRFFSGRTDIIILTIDPAKLARPIIAEDLYGHGTFPHIYGTIPLTAITGTSGSAGYIHLI